MPTAVGLHFSQEHWKKSHFCTDVRSPTSSSTGLPASGSLSFYHTITWLRSSLFSSLDIIHWGFYFNIITVTSWLICVGLTYLREEQQCRSLTITCWCHDGRSLRPYVSIITDWSYWSHRSNPSIRPRRSRRPQTNRLVSIASLLSTKSAGSSLREKSNSLLFLRYAKGGRRLLADFSSKGQFISTRLSIQHTALCSKSNNFHNKPYMSAFWYRCCNTLAITVRNEDFVTPSTISYSRLT
jgi:hypothetical protein